MARLTVNLDEIPDIQMPDVGRHRAKLMECKEDVSQSSGNDMLVWLWEVLEGDSEGRRIKSYTTRDEDALGGLKMHLRAFGYTEGVADVDTDKFLKKTAVIICAKSLFRDKDSGEQREGVSVATVLPDAGSGGEGTSKDSGSKPRILKGSKKAEGDEIPF